MKIIKNIFTFLGIIFILLILTLIFINQFNIKSFINVDNITQKKENTEITNTNTNTKNSLLTDNQIQKLESIGIDTEKLSTTITPEMMTCFEEKLGKERVLEIDKGDAPSAIEVIKTSSCITK